MSTTEASLRAALLSKGGSDSLRVYPGPDWDRDPEGCLVLDGRGESWSVYRMDRGRKDLRSFPSRTEALEFAYRRWVLWDEDA